MSKSDTLSGDSASQQIGQREGCDAVEYFQLTARVIALAQQLGVVVLIAGSNGNRVADTAVARERSHRQGQGERPALVLSFD